MMTNGWPDSQKIKKNKAMTKTLKQGVYFVKDGKPVEKYEESVERDRLLVIGKYCKFYLSMKDLGNADFDEAQKRAASLGSDWQCPDSFQGRTMALLNSEIREKAQLLGAKWIKDVWYIWTNEEFDAVGAWDLAFRDGNLDWYIRDYGSRVCAVSAFQS